MSEFKDKFPCGLKVREFYVISPWGPLFRDEVFKCLNENFSRNFTEETKLRQKEFELLCQEIYGNENIFYNDCYGGYLNWQKMLIEAKQESHLNELKILHKTLLLKKINAKSDLFNPVLLDSTQLIPFCEVKFEHKSYSKPGEETVAFVGYSIKLDRITFKKILYSGYGLSGIYDKYLTFAEREQYYKENIPEIKFEIARGLNLVKKRRLNHLDWEALFFDAFNENNINLNYDWINEQAMEIIEKNSKDLEVEFIYNLQPNDKLKEGYDIRSKIIIHPETVNKIGIHKFFEL